MKKYKSILLVVVFSLMVGGASGASAETLPTLSSLNPTSGFAGTSVVANGSGFDVTNNSVNLFLAGSTTTIPNITSSNGTSTTFIVPSLSATGTYAVSITNASGTSNALPFIVNAYSSDLCLVLSSDLNQGSSDNTFDKSVTKLQKFLIKHGFMTIPPGTPLGYLGQLTEKAIMDFQKHYGIPATGQVGPLTRGEIALITCGTTLPTPSIASSTISLITPTSGQVGTRVNIYGYGPDFTSTSSAMVQFGGISIKPMFLKSYELGFSFTVPSGAATGTISVSLINGTDVSNSLTFTVTSNGHQPPPPQNHPPVISGFNPSSAATGTSVTVSGTGFTPSGNFIDFGSSNLGPFTATFFTHCGDQNGCVGSGAINFSVPNVATGTYPVVVANSNGTSSPMNFLVVATSTNSSVGTMPLITSISPTASTSGAPVTIIGSGFIGLNLVEWVGGPDQLISLTPTATSSNSINFNVPSNSKPGVYRIAVIERAGTPQNPRLLIQSNWVNFTVKASSTSNGNKTKTANVLDALNNVVGQGLLNQTTSINNAIKTVLGNLEQVTGF